MPTPDLVAEISVWKTIMNKRFTSLMTTLILSVFFSISASAYDVEVNGIYYNLNHQDKTAEVTYKEKEIASYFNNIEISSSITIDGIEYSVTSIGNMSFYLCSGLTSVTIPNTVTSIGDYAFYHCDGLTSITIPNSVTSIGISVFASCSGLTHVYISNSLTSISESAFSFCTGLTSITIPNSVITIGKDSFGYCI